MSLISKPKVEQWFITHMAKEKTNSEMLKKIQEVSDLKGRPSDEAYTALNNCNGDANQVVDLLFEKTNNEIDTEECNEVRKKKQPASVKNDTPPSNQTPDVKSIDKSENCQAVVNGKREGGGFISNHPGIERGFDGGRGRRRGGSGRGRSGGRSVPTTTKSDQTKISDYYQVRRSCRTSAQELKKKEKVELEKLILNRERELNEEHLRVQDIEGKGRGVMAARLFTRGEFLVEYAGDLIELPTAKKRESQYQLSPAYGCYMYYFNFNNKHYCIDATEETGRLGRLVNHSRLKPNSGTRVVMVNDIPRLILVALKRIQEGEEILYDYGDRNKESLLAHPWLAL